MKATPCVLAVVSLLLLTACGPKASKVTALQRKEGAHFVSEAQFAITVRDYARAEGLLTKATEACPDTGDYWITLGVVRKKQNNRSGAKSAYANAADAYHDAYERDPKQPELGLQEVYALLLLGRQSDAQSRLDKLAKRHADNRAVKAFVENKQIDRIMADPSFKDLAL